MRSCVRVARSIFLFATLYVAAWASAATINVNTAVDENNGNTMGPNPLSQGCSLREALAEVFANTGVAANGCTAVTVDGPNTININVAGPIVVNGLVPDPNAISGSPMIRNGNLPQIKVGSMPGTGAVTVNGTASSKISCPASPNGTKIFVAQSGANFTLSNVTVQDCTASGGGIGITSNSAKLTLTNDTFSNIHSDSGGVGGAINHSGAALALNNVIFTGNGTSVVATPSNESGDGGAIAISGVSLPDTINMDTVIFNNNTARNNGGAIYWTQIDSLGHNFQISAGIFNGNSAQGSGAQDGGGAIWAQTDADTDLLSFDLFTILGTQFISNTAPNGAGGAIVISSGQLAYKSASVPFVGGVWSSNFFNNSAGGATTANLQGGSGGAIFASGNVTIVQSSFLNNTATGSGGAIVLSNASTSSLPLVLANVTINGNTAAQNGGALANINANGKVTLLNDTLAGNSANAAGGTAGGGEVFNANSTAAEFSVRNTILGASTGSGGNCAGQPFFNAGNNLQYSPNTTSCGATVTIGDPNLAAPSVFGGPNLFVLTMSINGDHSPAQGTGDNGTCNPGPVLTFDGTGSPTRPAGDPNCDIGAFESSTSFPVSLQSFSVE